MIHSFTLFYRFYFQHHIDSYFHLNLRVHFLKYRAWNFYVTMHVKHLYSFNLRSIQK